MGYDHADIYEASALLYQNPEVVQFENAVDDRLGKMVYYDILPISEEFRSESGCLWKSKHATAEMGKRVWETQLATLNKVIQDEFPLK